jgi:hypothetical protein
MFPLTYLWHENLKIIKPVTYDRFIYWGMNCSKWYKFLQPALPICHDYRKQIPIPCMHTPFPVQYYTNILIFLIWFYLSEFPSPKVTKFWQDCSKWKAMLEVFIPQSIPENVIVLSRYTEVLNGLREVLQLSIHKSGWPHIRWTCMIQWHISHWLWTNSPNIVLQCFFSHSQSDEGPPVRL